MSSFSALLIYLPHVSRHFCVNARSEGTLPVHNSQPNPLGKPLFECEKYPVKEAVVSANGGWGNIVATYLIYIPLGAITVSAFIAAALGWLGENADPSTRPMLWGLWIAVIVILYILTVFLWKRGYAYAESVAITAYENGIEIRKPKSEMRREYQQIADIYFGTKSKLAASSLAVGSLVKPRQMRAAQGALNSRMSIEFNDGTVVRFPMCLAYFKEPSIEKLIDQISQKCPDLFPAASSN
jgi:hypothetical protein